METTKKASEEKAVKTAEKPKTVWEVLSQVDCSEHIEVRDSGKVKLKYLSWAWAWGILTQYYPEATYTVREWEGFPYLFDANLGYLVETSVTIPDKSFGGKTLTMRLPVMDGANKAQKSERYTYTTKFGGEKTVEPATMFDINTAIMRCLTKNIALFGLGHYIYAGEDLPVNLEDEVKKLQEKQEALTAIKEEYGDLSQLCIYYKKSENELTYDEISKSLNKRKAAQNGTSKN